MRTGHSIDKNKKKNLEKLGKKNKKKKKKKTKNVMNSLLLNLTLGVFYSLGMCRALDKRAIH